jgi:hypothetical protein
VAPSRQWFLPTRPGKSGKPHLDAATPEFRDHRGIGARVRDQHVDLYARGHGIDLLIEVKDRKRKIDISDVAPTVAASPSRTTVLRGCPRSQPRLLKRI